ncbi:putative extracellular protein [Botryosphaeria dothidea]|uniref:Extracellular protein n=1 Tax=Botryosphaeria dothidea TaxID=55169 RepID=A0A8H4J0M9_9PEZI|nr:putative extracellular protein [Botryosphaeria dothidea]
MRSFLYAAGLSQLGHLASALPLSAYASSSVSATVCNGTFNAITAQQFVDAMNPGWNLGNTLDAVEDEGDWNNAPVTEDTFDDVKKAGFKGIRLPITWAYHFTSEAPDYTVDPAWLQRVEDVVDMITDRGFYTIVNVHHDSWVWADLTASGANYTLIEEKFYKLWYQIGEKLACKSELVAFEPINEPPGTTAEHGAELNKLNNIMLKAINEAGGFNAQRVVTLPGLGEDSIKTSQWFEPPSSNFSNPWAIQYHYYSPYDFIFSAWGKTRWGSDEDKATLEADLANIRNNFTDVPLIIGEWAASPVATESAARWKYFDFIIRTANKYNTSTVLWDNGNDFLDRSAHTWRDQSAIDIYLNAVDGVSNSLPDSTEDGQATSQFTSAYIWHQVGTPVVAQSLPFLFNDNTLSSISVGGNPLAEGSDYSTNGSSITFTQSFLSQHVSTDAAPGVKANLTLSFSAGADIEVQIVQWDTPTVASNSTTAAAADNGSDFTIPITYKGLSKPATVLALTTDGTIVFDDWTQYLGPLEKGRATYSNQWNWDASNIILTSAAVKGVLSKGKSTVFTIEFYPRVPGNSVNYTLTV